MGPRGAGRRARGGQEGPGMSQGQEGVRPGGSDCSQDGTASKKVGMGMPDMGAGGPVDVGLGKEPGGGPGGLSTPHLGLGTYMAQHKHKEKDSGQLDI